MSIETIKPQVSNYSVTTRILIDFLERGRPGDMVSDLVLSAKCGRDTRPGSDGYGNLLTAIKHCERQGVVWRRDRGLCRIVCLTGLECVTYAKETRLHVRRASKRALARLGGVERSSLTEHDRTEYDRELQHHRLLNLFTHREPLRRIERSRDGEPLVTHRMLELFQD